MEKRVLDPGITPEAARSMREQDERLNDEYMRFLHQNTNWFREVHRNETFSVIDYSGVGHDGKECAIETKVRKCDVNTFDGIYIETKKMLALQDAYYQGKRPLYINFFQCKHCVLIFDLTKWFKDGNLPECRDVTIRNYHYNRVDEHETRFILPQREGHYYVAVNGRYIKRW